MTRVPLKLAGDDPAAYVVAAAGCAASDAAYLTEQMPEFLVALAASWRHAASVPHHSLCDGKPVCGCVRGLLLAATVPVCRAYLEHR